MGRSRRCGSPPAPATRTRRPARSTVCCCARASSCWPRAGSSRPSGGSRARSTTTSFPSPSWAWPAAGLRGGDAAGAAGWVIQAIERGSVEHGAADPDPVEWAYLVRALLCQGRLADAVAPAERYPSMTHTELERIRAVTASLAGSAAPVPVHAPRASVHVLPALGAPAWTEELCRTLRACGQDALAAAVEAGTRAPEPPQAAGTAPAPEPARMAPLSAEPRSARLKRRV